MARTPPSGHDPGRSRRRRDLAAIGFVALLLWGVTFLPPDTTLADVRRSGVLRACVPRAFPPLVQDDPERPGIDVELLERIADGLGVRLLTVTNDAMGRDFNPRNWRVTRAQCLVLAGGIVDTTLTRGFLVVTPPHLETGWAAVIHGDEPASLEGVTVGFFAGLTGLDRLALSRWLRERGADIELLTDADAARDALTSERYDIVVSEALSARRLAEATDSTVVLLPVGSGPVPIALGLWKGDLTLERAIVHEIRGLQRRGAIDELVDRYALAPIAETCSFCR